MQAWLVGPRRISLVSAAMLVPASAAAAPSTPSPFEAVVPIWTPLAAGLIALTAIVAMFVYRGIARRAAAERQEMATALTRSQAVMAGVGGGFYIWSQKDGAQIASPNLADFLGLAGDTAIDFQAIRGALDTADSRALNAVVGKLRDSGERFSLRVRRASDGAPLRAKGLRLGRSGNGHGLGEADVLWLQVDRDGAAEAKRLAKARDRLHGILDALPLPIWFRKDDLAIADCNETYVRAVEAKSASEVVDKGIELAGSVIADRGRGLASHARSQGNAESETHHIVIEGSRRLLDLTEAPLKAGGLAGYALDITGIEDAQSELARHVAGHAEVLENLATAIAIYGPDRRLKFFNGAFVKLWELDEGWLHMEPHFDEVLESLRERRQLPETADFPAWKRSRLKLFTSLIEPLEEQLHLPDGRTLRSVISPHPLGGMLYTFEDVTDRLALERSYNTLIQVQSETLNNLAEAVAVFGSDGRLKLFTPAIERTWNLHRDYLASEPHFSDVLEKIRPLFRYGQDWEKFKSAIIGRLARRAARHGKIERNDGKTLQYAFQPLPDGGVLITSLDITDSTRVSRALRERNEALEAADKLKSEFIANVSYELRTPLNTIMGFIEILNNEYFGPLNERQREYSQGILESSEELLALINDILDLAMIEAGRMTLEIEAVDIREMLWGVFSLTRERARTKDLKLALDCPDDIGTLDLDERRTKHALLNLMGNAIEYTPPGGEIVLSARRLDSEVVLAVADSGIGIAESEQSHIFDMFVRGKKPTGHRRGAGLGLSLVRSFIDLHGGRVEITSTPDAGTTVSCYLPVRRPTGRAALTADLFKGAKAKTGSG
ncbi:MAG: PAS-domain containing protein [Alphaproteobacteria bacterium]|nr:PAS-domain containing protein [Alphaproteobacteria bacterium]